MAGKTGVYSCTGCDIGSATDVAALQKLVTDELKVPVCKTHPFLCGEVGVNLLKGELQREGLDRLVLGACSSRYHKETFDFGKQTLVARTPLREYVAWTQPHQTEDTQMMAADYLRMHVAAIKMQEAPVPFRQQTEKTLLVVGGGVTGMTAALEAARTGYPVHLVEKERRLGGFALELHCRTPSASPFHSIQSAAPDELVCATESHHGITVHKSSRVVSISGQTGDFTVVLTGSAGETTVRAGAIVLATGGKPYEASRVTHLGSAHDNVVTTVQAT